MVKKQFTFIAVILLLLLLSACSGSSEGNASERAGAEGKEKGTYLTFATAGPTGNYYLTGSGMAEVWSKNIEGVEASAVTSAGSPQNLSFIKSGDAEIAIVESGSALNAWEGSGVFEEEGPNEEFRSMFFTNELVSVFITNKKSGIDSIEDIRGRSIAVGSRGSGIEGYVRNFLSIYDLDYTNGDAKPVYVGSTESAQMLTDDQVDAVFLAGSYASISELMASGNMKLIPIEEEKLEEFVEVFPQYIPYELEANRFGEHEAIQTFAVGNVVIANKDLPDDLIYELMSEAYANTDKLASFYDELQYLDPKDATTAVLTPFHPGAIKYLEENGVEIPDELRME